MVTLEPIRRKTIWKSLRLRVTPEQKNFVAPNWESLAQGIGARLRGREVHFLAICDGGVPVGFLMVTREEAVWELWRFMIGAEFQHRGYGRQALGLVLEWMQARGGERCKLSYEPENTPAAALYRSFGFRETGELDCGEWVAERPL